MIGGEPGDGEKEDRDGQVLRVTQTSDRGGMLMDRSTHLRDLVNAALRNPTSRRALLRRAAVVGLAQPAAGGWLSRPGAPAAWAAPA